MDRQVSRRDFIQGFMARPPEDRARLSQALWQRANSHEARDMFSRMETRVKDSKESWQD